MTQAIGNPSHSIQRWLNALPLQHRLADEVQDTADSLESSDESLDLPPVQCPCKWPVAVSFPQFQQYSKSIIIAHSPHVLVHSVSQVSHQDINSTITNRQP